MCLSLNNCGVYDKGRMEKAFNIKNPVICLVLLTYTILSVDAHTWTKYYVKERFLHAVLREDEDYMNRDSTNNMNCLNKITEEEVENIFKSLSLHLLTNRQELEERLALIGRVIRLNDRRADPSLNRNRMSDTLVHIRERQNLIFEEATNEIVKRYDLSSWEVSYKLPKYPLNGNISKASRDNCIERTQPQIMCDSRSRYRTQSGQCNNLNNPDWGSAIVCQRRLLHASYVGTSGYRVAVSGDPLPSPRSLSLNLHYHLNRPTNYVSHMYMFFGQLLDHDIILTPVSTTVNNQAIECCPPENETHPQCAPILVDQNDPFYSEFGVTCLNFVRSAVCATCALGHRIQSNQVTSFIDASFVYGNSENETSALRENDGTGRLRVQNRNDGDLMPQSFNPREDQCSFTETNEICFQGGDTRANQHTILASLHTVFLREHNRLADGLRQINTHWGEERIFQEARRIVGAEMQVITYKEYLPITLGTEIMTEFELWISNRGTTSYNPQIDPTMILEFTTAAFRFGHSLINSVITNSPLNATNQPRLLRDDFFQPFDLYNGVIGQLVSGASYSSSQRFDRHLVPDVTNYLYRIRGNQTGLDLAATNINRGRDHGVPPYVDMVRLCSGGKIIIRKFSDLYSYQIMRYNQVKALRRNYRNVADVDLWTGILMETPIEGAVVGPTAACIIGLQFKNLKFGDRFYFEHRNQRGSFTTNQMQELRKTTLSKILCLNTNAAQMPKNAMLKVSRRNKSISCTKVAGLNLAYWKE